MIERSQIAGFRTLGNRGDFCFWFIPPQQKTGRYHNYDQYQSDDYDCFGHFFSQLV